MELPFKETYLVTLAERKDRYETMRKRIDYMGWDVKDFFVVKHPISDFIVKQLGPDLMGRGDLISNGAIFNCTREQYTLVKSAFLRGVENIAIIEDDASFLKNHKIWKEYFNNLPDDWDVLRINSLRGKETEDLCNLPENDGKLWVKQPIENNIFGAAFYVVNQKAMMYLINCTNAVYQPLDNVFAYNKNPHLNIYVPRIPLSLCLEDGYKSNLRDDTKTNPIFSAYKTIPNLNEEDYI